MTNSTPRRPTVVNARWSASATSAVGGLRHGQPTATVTATDTGTVTEIEPDQATEVDRPWVVIVWNDPINLMSYVTWVLQKLFGYSIEKATELMLDVHHKGRAAVAEGTREQAEMHVFRLHEHGLWATMEHDR